MKSILKSVMLTLLFVGLIAVNAKAQEPGLDANLQFGNVKIAVDSAVSGTKYSKTVILNQATKEATKSINFLKAAKVAVYGRQTNDSVKALIYLQYGQITNGTEGKTYGTVLLDSIYNLKKIALIDLSSYSIFSEFRLKVISATGSGYLPYWSATFAGQGYTTKESSANKQIVR